MPTKYQLQYDLDNLKIMLKNECEQHDKLRTQYNLVISELDRLKSDNKWLRLLTQQLVTIIERKQIRDN